MDIGSWFFRDISVTSESWMGVRDSIPLMLGVVPVGITCGTMALAAGLTGGETLLISVFMFAGASQFGLNVG